MSIGHSNSSFVKCLFEPFVYFSIGLIDFFVRICRILNVFWIEFFIAYMCCKYLLSFGGLPLYFLLWMNSFSWRPVCKFFLYALIFILSCFRNLCLFKKCLTCLSCEGNLLFSSKNFTVLPFTCRSLIHLKLIFCVRYEVVTPIHFLPYSHPIDPVQFIKQPSFWSLYFNVTCITNQLTVYV